MTTLTGHFVREHKQLAKLSAEYKKVASEALHAAATGPAALLEVLLPMITTPTLKHNSDTDPEFYNKLFELMLNNVQSYSERNVFLASLFSYLHSIEFAGFAPIFSVNPVLSNSYVTDVEPVFNILLESEELAILHPDTPNKCLALRVSVNLDGELTIIALPAAAVFLEKVKQAKAQLRPTPSLQMQMSDKPKKAKTPKQPKKPANSKKKPYSALL